MNELTKQCDLNKYSKSYFEFHETLCPQVGRQAAENACEHEQQHIHAGNKTTIFVVFFFKQYSFFHSFRSCMNFDLYFNEFNRSFGSLYKYKRLQIGVKTRRFSYFFSFSVLFISYCDQRKLQDLQDKEKNQFIVCV